jgi:hypothetical protein
VARELGAAIDVGSLTPVAELLTDPHRLIRKHDKMIRRIAKTGASIPHDKPCLDVVVAEGSVDRGLRIMDAVLKSMDSRRWPVVVTAARKCSRDGVWASTTVEVEGEAIEFGLSEVFDSVVIGQRDRPASLLDVVRPRRPEIVREKRGTGRLRLEIKATVQLPRRSWGDSRGTHLENLLAEFFAGIHVAVAALKAQHEREGAHPESHNHVHGFLSRAFTKAIEHEKWLGDNPMDKVKKQTVPAMRGSKRRSAANTILPLRGRRVMGTGTGTGVGADGGGEVRVGGAGLAAGGEVGCKAA